VPQAEQVLSDVARQAGGLVQDLWRRRRGKQDLPEMLRQLELVITGAFGITLQLHLERNAEAQKSRSRRLFGSDDAPRQYNTVPATDGRSIWIPVAAEDADIIKDFENVRVMALQQAARAHRASGLTLSQAPDPLVRAIYEVLEADAADIDLVTRFRGLTGAVNGFRRQALEHRPAPADLEAELRPLEQWVHEILDIPCEAATQSRAHPATRSLQLALELAPDLLKATPDISRELAGVLHRDLWVGELRGAAAVGELPDIPIRATRDDRVIEARSGEPSDPWPEIRPTDTWPGDIRVAPHVLDSDPDRTVFLNPPSVDELTSIEDSAELPAWVDSGPLQDVEVTQPMIIGAALAVRSLELAAKEIGEAAATVTETQGDIASAPATTTQNDSPGDVLVYPEWDYQTAAYRTTGASVAVLPASLGPEAWIDSVLDVHHGLLQGIRQRFEALRAQRRQSDEVDIDAHVDGFGDRRAGVPRESSTQAARADVATLLLIDVGPASLEWVSSTHQLIDLQREAVLLACLALYSLGEPYSVWAFAADGPQRTGMRCLKHFTDAYSDEVAQRIAGLKPEHPARTGAALRHATSLLSQQTAQHRMMLLLSDGTPHEIDDYSGRYGMEDVRQSVREARLQGISSLCFTTDQLNGNYLPSVFGEQQSTVLYRPELLPSALTQWLHRLMRL
jgi:nitric oxide reductase NorD protein